MSNNENFKVMLILIGCICIYLFALSIISYSAYNDGKKIQLSLGYAIGILKDKASVGTKGAVSPPKFDYSINNKNFNDVRSTGRGNPNIGLIGNQYLVVYDTTNPDNAAILLDYPIKDSAMFIQHKKDFAEKPLNLTPYFRSPILFYLEDY